LQKKLLLRAKYRGLITFYKEDGYPDEALYWKKKLKALNEHIKRDTNIILGALEIIHANQPNRPEEAGTLGAHSA
jgi:hypothetical protein